MAKPENDDDPFPEKQEPPKWGTWEELLLACAVNRHGTDSWDSVSIEIQNRSRNLTSSLTATTCRDKYEDLRKRFTTEMALPEPDKSEISNTVVPWLEELRKLRVDELRRELEQYDLSISSLQSKVKKLEEEREETEIEIEKPDLVEKEEIRDEPVQISGEPVIKPVIESVSVSISPDLKDEESPGTGSEKKEEIGEAKVTGEDSCRGSCESVVKESTERVESERRTESMAESKGRAEEEEEEGKETSDVQSSASLPRKVTSEPENEDQSPMPSAVVESQPSISFVKILLSQSCGSHFSRRLETQEAPEYTKIIREHVDFEIIRKRLEEGWYKSSMSKLFRDLLLLINNVRVFYNKGSSEFDSAEQLNQLVKKQMSTTLKKTKQEEFSKMLKGLKEAVPVSSKPRMSVPNPIIACRKRSSLAGKPLLVSQSGSDKKTDLVTEKDENSGKDDDEPLISRKVMKGRPSSSKMVAIRNVKKGDSVADSKGVDQSKETTDEEKKGSGNSKKKSAVSFLKRMKVGSSSSDDTAVETLKLSSGTDSSTSGKGGGAEPKKKADAKKRAATPTAKKQTNEKESPVKKNNGRAAKREASTSPVLTKRSKESGEKETGSSSSTRSKKRVRR